MGGKRSRPWRSWKNCTKHSSGWWRHPLSIGWIWYRLSLKLIYLATIWCEWWKLKSILPQIIKGSKKHITESKSNHKHIASLENFKTTCHRGFFCKNEEKKKSTRRCASFTCITWIRCIWESRKVWLTDSLTHLVTTWNQEMLAHLKISLQPASWTSCWWVWPCWELDLHWRWLRRRRFVYF